MTLATLVIGDRTFRLDTDVEQLKAEILEAALSGAQWVTVHTATGDTTDVLVTSTTEARLERVREKSLGAGASGPSTLGIEDFDEFGL